MRRVLAIGIAVVASGCATPPPIEDSPAEVSRPSTISIDDREFEAPNIAALWNGRDGWLEVGNTRDHAEALFKPDGAKMISELPPTLQPAQFKAWGWENKKTGVSFGSVYDVARKRVVLALLTQSGKELAEVQALVTQYKNKFLNPAISIDSDPRVQFYFWSPTEGSRAMICSVTNKTGGYTVTAAVGLTPLMDAIDATPEKAGDFVRRGIEALDIKKKPVSQAQPANQEGP